ncbi:MAG: DUF3108 domain-containing protein [Candidatus Omnitrophica bacterium]|nr:DUF3108 domain-containing protein [Candidatus Omnitrophota bacterium]MCM8792920.1 DUF3108 domain-containing protein [Candidatus Omnitrophota bacterium]
MKPKEIREIAVKEPTPELKIGEKLIYEVYWMKMPIGIATAEVKEMVEIKGRKAYHLVGTARSHRWFSFIFKVDDYVESFLDKETILSIKHIAIRNEGRYQAHMVLDYDWEKRILNFQNLVDGTKATFPLPWEAVDEFSAFYYFRLQKLSLGKSLEFVVNQVEKNWLVKIGITNFGKMNLPQVGVFPAFMIEPIPYLQDKPLEKGNAWVWVSNDEKRIPLMLKVQVNIPFIGTVFAILKKIEQVKDLQICF